MVLPSKLAERIRADARNRGESPEAWIAAACRESFDEAEPEGE